MKLYILCGLLTIVQAFFGLELLAQKLPKKQIGSIWTPANIKIDGKADEWKDTYQAYNKSTDIYYTISNDNENLYLITRVISPSVLFYKVMTGGITFQIKNGGHDVSFTYPAFNNPPPVFKGFFSNRNTMKPEEIESETAKNNVTFSNTAKEVEISGVENLPDRISIYNEYGIKIAGRFDAIQGYVCEIEIPLKYLGAIDKAASTFTYKLSVVGKNMKARTQITSIVHADGTESTSQADIDALNQIMERSYNVRYAETSVTGEYTLAKK